MDEQESVGDNSNFNFDESSLFLLQLAALLSRSAKWRKCTKLRVLIPTDCSGAAARLTTKIDKQLEIFRIKAEIIIVEAKNS